MQNNSHKDFFRLHFLGLPPGKSPGGTAPGREIPLIGVADVSLRGLRSPGGLLTGLPPGRRSHRTTTCSLTGIVKITETISQRNNDIAP